MNLPQFPRQPTHPNVEATRDLDKEICPPDWRCFCCQDTGLITCLLAKMVIPDYQPLFDKHLVCKKPNCEAGRNFINDDHFDQRLNAAICSSLDKHQREQWKQTVLAKWDAAKSRQAIEVLSKGMNLRSRDRTPQEEQENQRRVADLVAADFKKEVVQEDDEF